MGVNLDPTDKVFSLQILVAQVVQIQNSVDDIASPVGISSNMLIKAAITKISFFLAFSPQLSMLATFMLPSLQINRTTMHYNFR